MSMNINNSPPILSSGLDISGLDLETALMAVQNERVRLLDTQLQTQLEEVQNRNDQVAKLHNLQTALNAAKEHFKSDDDATDKFSNIKINGEKASYRTGNIFKGYTNHTNPEHEKIINDINDAMKKAGFGESIGKDITKGELETLIQDVKNAVDRESNSQQMDMLRLQSMSGKRNEAFDVMTNFVKKMQDSRSAIIANLR